MVTTRRTRSRDRCDDVRGKDAIPDDIADEKSDPYSGTDGGDEPINGMNIDDADGDQGSFELPVDRDAVVDLTGQSVNSFSSEDGENNRQASGDAISVDDDNDSADKRTAALAERLAVVTSLPVKLCIGALLDAAHLSSSSE